MITNLAKKKKKGFTLVEVIIVLAIIAIIAAIAIPNLTKVRQESKIKADIQSSETINRTIIGLITDETIAYTSGSGGTITFNFNANNKTLTTIAIGTGVKVKESSGYVAGGASVNSTVLLDYFKGIKAPQEEGKVKYVVTISGVGSVTTNRQ